MAVTLQNIADQLQISKATVSRSLRNDPLILPRTRASVHAAALQMGYEGRPRGVVHGEEKAKKSASQPQRTLGLLFPGTSLEMARHDFNFMQIMQGIMEETERCEILLMVHTLKPEERGGMAQHPEYVPGMVQKKACQALIVWGAMKREDIAYLAAQMPVICIGRTYDESPVDSIIQDNVDGTRKMLAYLASFGHRHLAWVGAYYEATFLEGRQAGFVTGCISAGLDLNQQRFFGSEIYHDRQLQAENSVVKAAHDGITAFVCGNDAVAMQVIVALESAGHRVPKDVSVTGFDANQPSDSERRITSVNPRFVELGRSAVRIANQRLTQKASPPCVLTVRSELVIGETAAVHRVSPK